MEIKEKRIASGKIDFLGFSINNLSAFSAGSAVK
jgi:hypothetical protein